MATDTEVADPAKTAAEAELTGPSPYDTKFYRLLQTLQAINANSRALRYPLEAELQRMALEGTVDGKEV